METSYVLLGYTYYTDCQGTKDRNYGTTLVKVPKSNSADEFIRARETLYNLKHEKWYYDIELDSIENLTIDFYDCST